MKKILINMGLVLVFIFIYLLQANFFINFKIAGVMPNIFIILMLFIGLFMGRTSGIFLGLIFGVLFDVFISQKIGITSVMLSVIALIGSVFDRNFSKDNRFAIMLMVGISTVIYELGTYLLRYIVLGINLEWAVFIKILLLESLYNVILTIILYPIMQFVGYDIEEEYKGSRILTRYF